MGLHITPMHASLWLLSSIIYRGCGPSHCSANAPFWMLSSIVQTGRIRPYRMPSEVAIIGVWGMVYQ